MPKLSYAVYDLRETIRLRNMWWVAAYENILGRYRRTLLGPLWLVLGTAIAIGGMGVVWAKIFKLDVATYFPYITAGWVSWQFITSAVTEGTDTYITQSETAHAVKLPWLFFTAKQLSVWLLLYLHNLLTFFGVIAIFGINFNVHTLLFFPGLILIQVNMFWICTLVGVVSARFRDIKLIIISVMPITLLITPVMWKPNMLGRSQILVDINPFAHAIHLLRAPLLGEVAPMSSWLVMVGFALVGGAITLVVFSKVRNSIIFWL